MKERKIRKHDKLWRATLTRTDVLGHKTPDKGASQSLIGLENGGWFSRNEDVKRRNTRASNSGDHCGNKEKKVGVRSKGNKEFGRPRDSSSRIQSRTPMWLPWRPNRELNREENECLKQEFKSISWDTRLQSKYTRASLSCGMDAGRATLRYSLPHHSSLHIKYELFKRSGKKKIQWLLRGRKSGHNHHSTQQCFLF